MSLFKESSIKVIQAMPENCTTSDIMAELYFKQKVEQGLHDVKEGKTIGHHEVKQKLNQWKKSIGL